MLGKYKYTDKELKTLLKSIVILIDTREKNNDHIIRWFDKHNINYKSKKLDYGDYSFYLPKNEELNIPRDMYYTDLISIERKNSADELASNLSSNRNRIEDEFLRHKGEMTLLIENSTYVDICNGNYRSEYSPKAFIGTLHSFSKRYDVPFVFIPSEETARFIYCSFYYYLRNMFQ